MESDGSSQRAFAPSTWPDVTPSELEFSARFERLTHYIFRYPAKFHPPVVQALLSRYTQPGDLVIDPFCGSGTLLVEASTLGRHSIGVDVDPVAVAVTAVKARRYPPDALSRSVSDLLAAVLHQRRPADEYERFMFSDIDEAQYHWELEGIESNVPAIPNLFHWFRRYVIADLARIARTIDLVPMPDSHRQFARVVLASILRNVSQADPVPVSGLEVTKWMREKERQGRLIDPFSSFEKAMTKAFRACGEFFAASQPGVQASAYRGDATCLDTVVPDIADAVLTSPPYHGAVDYYRRHQLEMFWLGLTRSQQERVDLLQHYIGRPHVPPRHPWAAESPPSALAKEWEERMASVSLDRARAFRHYMVAMHKFFFALASRVRAGGAALMIVGHSTWNRTEVPTTSLFRELSADLFDLTDVHTYPVKNRYMSYTRRNSADINREYVLVMRRTESQV